MDPLPTHREKLNALFGRCLIRLQQYELLMKRMVETQSTTTVGSSVLPADLRLGMSSLGVVAGRFFETLVVASGAPDRRAARDRQLEALAHSSVAMRTSVSIEMTAESHEATRMDVLQLIELRNTLVHHFLERFDLRSEAGCADAAAFLSESCERIGRDLERLQDWARSISEMRRTAAAFMGQDSVLDFLCNGIAPDGVVDWPWAGIVAGLREALLQNSPSCDEDGWLPLAIATAYLGKHEPEQTPEKYHCRSWVQVLNDSKAFDLKYLREDGLSKTALFRVRRSSKRVTAPAEKYLLGCSNEKQ